jgi:hypothetical protein
LHSRPRRQYQIGSRVMTEFVCHIPCPKFSNPKVTVGPSRALQPRQTEELHGCKSCSSERCGNCTAVACFAVSIINWHCVSSRTITLFPIPEVVQDHKERERCWIYSVHCPWTSSSFGVKLSRLSGHPYIADRHTEERVGRSHAWTSITANILPLLIDITCRIPGRLMK